MRTLCRAVRDAAPQRPLDDRRQSECQTAATTPQQLWRHPCQRRGYPSQQLPPEPCLQQQFEVSNCGGSSTKPRSDTCAGNMFTFSAMQVACQSVSCAACSHCSSGPLPVIERRTPRLAMQQRPGSCTARCDASRRRSGRRSAGLHLTASTPTIVALSCAAGPAAAALPASLAAVPPLGLPAASAAAAGIAWVAGALNARLARDTVCAMRFIIAAVSPGSSTGVRH
jgi:hypothetical protein